MSQQFAEWILRALLGMCIVGCIWGSCIHANSMPVRRNDILFVASVRQGEWSIFVVSPAGSRPRKLTRTEALEFDPVWSPDGTRIAYAAMNDPKERRSDIHVTRADGSQRRRLTQFPAGTLAGSPTWSPDGKRIAFCTVAVPANPEHESKEQPLLWVMNVEGRNLKRLRHGMFPSWSPDGKQILFTATSSGGKEGTSNLHVMDIDGRNARVITRQGASMGAWSPDGKRIAYIGEGGRYPEGYPYFDLFVMNADGSHPKQITHGGEGEAYPQWLADGRKILFTVLDSYGISRGIYTVDPDGGKARKLTDFGFAWLGGGIFYMQYLVPMHEPRPRKARKPDPDLEPLLEAIASGNVSKLRALLDRGASPNAASPTGWSVLMQAAQYGSPAMMHLLLERGAKPNAAADDGHTALWWAVRQNRMENVRALLEKGASVDAQDLTGRTALMLAIDYNLLSMVELLLDNSADANAREKEGDTVLIQAARSGHPALVSALLRRDVNVNARGEFGRTALIWASNAVISRALLDKGADINVRDDTGRTALMWAVYKRQDEIVQLLRKAGARE